MGAGSSRSALKDKSLRDDIARDFIYNTLPKNKEYMNKEMNKVMSAYEKARHAYEKANHYNEKFYKKYGFYAVDEDGSETSSFQSESWTDYEDAAE